MQRSESQAFRSLLTDVMAYYGKDASPFVLDLWWNAMQGFDLEQVSKALQTHATDAERGQFAPKVADIARVLAGTATDRAALAWGKVHEAMGSVGAYTDVVFDDPAIHAVVEDLGGWPKLCRTLLDDLGYVQHRFQESHRAYTGRGAFDYARRLSGDRSADSEYAKRGLPPPSLAFVGNIAHARAVLANGSATGKTAISFRPLEAIEDAPAGLLPSGKPMAAA